MIKLTELKKLIKTNDRRDMFYAEQNNITKILFNYKNQLIIELQGLNYQKFYEYLQTQKIVHDDLSIHSYYCDPELKDKLEKLTNDTLKGGKYNQIFLLNTGIEFNKPDQWRKEITTSYKIFKSDKGLLKIRSEFLSVLNLNITDGCNLYTNEDQNICFIYNNTNDIIGLCIVEKFDMSELSELIKIA